MAESSPGSLVRSFMVTGGRTSTALSGLSIETIVGRSDSSHEFSNSLQFESRTIYDHLAEPTSVAEVAAHFKLPILATLVLVGDMVSQGVLAHADLGVVDRDLLMRIRQRIAII